MIFAGGAVLIVACAVHIGWIKWETRTDTIPRSELRSAVADGECVRVTWATDDALLMPMMSPQTRQGRIRQSELLAKLLAPRAPAS